MDSLGRGFSLVPLTQPAVCSLLACTDKELRSLASRLKDWFGALHEDANRVIKPTSSDTAQGSKKPFPLHLAVVGASQPERIELSTAGGAAASCQAGASE